MLPPNTAPIPVGWNIPCTVNSCFPWAVKIGQPIADLQAVAFGEGAREQNRIGLRQIAERVGELGRRAVELVLAQLLIAGGIHAEDQQVAFIRIARYGR